MVHKNQSEKGQVLVIMALLAIALIGMLALVLDGGTAYTSRRKAQNAADAGALAGADALCRTFDADEAETVALDYAFNRNKATSAIAFADLSTQTVQVTATVEVDSLFAGIFGTDKTVARARARSGCFPVCAASTVLPVAWACKAPIIGESEFDPCGIEAGTYDNPGPTYLIMDSDKVAKDFNCDDPATTDIQEGPLDCDRDNDGINDALAGGDRSWLNLDGGAGSDAEMSNWITSGESPWVYEHRWYGGSVGVKGEVFKAAETRIGDVVTIPVFNIACDGWPDSTCGLGHEGDPVIAAGGTATLYFHVERLAIFVITCVADISMDTHCPAKNAFEAQNPGAKIKSIEGYFIEGAQVPGAKACTGSGSYTTGVFTVQLLP